MSAESTANPSKPATPRLAATPMRAITSLFRTPTRLGTTTPTAVSRHNKRSRARASSLSSPYSNPSTHNSPSLPAVVLQTYSVSTDSVVLTSLPCVPFCCHEDLLTMSRPQLESVVRALNARLPRRMRIGPEDHFWSDDQDCADECDEDEDDGLSRMSEAEMKRRIEELVGIRAVVGKNRVSRSGLGLGGRRGVPPAPKAVRTRDAAWRPYEKDPWEMEVDDAEDLTDPSIVIEDVFVGSSPLASRTRSNLRPRGRIDALTRLAILEEESEGNESKDEDFDEEEERPSKRQRVSLGGAAEPSEAESVVQADRGSRLIENMDVSGSPLLAADDGPPMDNTPGSDERAVSTTTDSYRGAEPSDEGMKVPLQRRRSARIKEIALKRASSLDSAKKNVSDAQGFKPSVLRSKTLSSRPSLGNHSTSMGGSRAGKDLNTPREFTIRLPFTSTPPDQKQDSSAWSAPRVLRSHSQRLQNVNQSTKNGMLGRSQSERYPRPSDMAFVTINRPRYRFTRRKAKGTEVGNGHQDFHPSAHVGSTPRQASRIAAEHLNGKHEHEKENEDPRVVSASKSPAMSGLHALPSALFGFLTPRSRAPSASTTASAPVNGNDSPFRTANRQGHPATGISDPAANEGAERVSEVLERMAVDTSVV